MTDSFEMESELNIWICVKLWKPHKYILTANINWTGKNLEEFVGSLDCFTWTVFSNTVLFYLPGMAVSTPTIRAGHEISHTWMKNKY